MKKNKIIILYILLIILFSASLAPKTFQNDTFFTIAGGQNTLKNGLEKIDQLTWHENLEFTNPRYVFNIIIALLYNNLNFLGIYIFVIIMTIIIGLTLFYIFIKTEININLSFLFSLIIMYLGQFVFCARAQIVSIWLFLLENYFIIRLLNTGKKRYSIYLILIGIIMANVHASIFLVCFIFFLPYFAEFLISKLKINISEDNKIIINKRKNILKFFITFLIVIFTGVCSPISISTPYISMLRESGGYSQKLIAELQPLVPVDSTSFTFLIIIVLGILIFTNTKIYLSDLFMLLGLSLMAINANRAVFYFIFIGSLFIVKLIDSFLNGYGFYNNIYPKKSKVLFLFLISVFISSLSIQKLISRINENYVDTLNYPVDACEYINNFLDKENMRIYNTFNYGSYMEFKGIKAFIDSRSGMYTEEFNKNTTVLKDFVSITSNYEHYQKVFDKYDINYVLINNTDIVNIYIVDNKSWEKIYQDDNFSIYERIN